jgi:methionine-rich copper-binding protein CopC
MKAGAYKVSWRVISADTHKVKGSFTFQVRP